MKSWMLSLFFLFSLSVQSLEASQLCSTVFKFNNHINTYEFEQVDVSETESQLLRSNARQYWSWARNEAHKYFEGTFEKLINFRGWIMGDAHNGNFGASVINGRLRWRNIDLDDAGHGPFVLDFVHYLTSLKVIDKDISSAEIWKAYLKGLSGKKVEVPEMIDDALSYSVSEIREIQEKKAFKKAKKEHLVLEEGFRLLTSRTTYNSIVKAISVQSPDVRVLDIVINEKQRSGNAYALRYVVLAEYKGHLTLLDLKEILPQAPGYFHYQGDAVKVFKGAVEYFWGKSLFENDQLFQIVPIAIDAQKNFLLSPRKIKLIEAPNKINSDKDFDLFAEVSYFNANRLGLMHANQKQSQQYKEEIDRLGQEDVLAAVKSMAKSYRHLLEKELKR